MNFVVSLSLFYLFSSVVSGYSFKWQFDVLREVANSCAFNEFESAIGLPLRLARAADIEQVLKYLTDLEKSDCQPIAVMAAEHMMDHMTRLYMKDFGPSFIDWVSHLRNPDLQLNPQQIKFAHEILPKVVDFIDEKPEQLLETLMNVIVSQQSPAVIPWISQDYDKTGKIQTQLV